VLEPAIDKHTVLCKHSLVIALTEKPQLVRQAGWGMICLSRLLIRRQANCEAFFLLSQQMRTAGVTISSQQVE
jgi:hypothetical protein